MIDQAYTFGRLPSVRNPRLFTIRQLARLMVLRSRHGDERDQLLADLSGDDLLEEDRS